MRGAKKCEQRSVVCLGVFLWVLAAGQPIYAQGPELRMLIRETGGLCVYHPDGKTIASLGRDNTIDLWDPTNGKKITSLAGHTNIITAVAFSPNGKTIASGGLE